MKKFIFIGILIFLSAGTGVFAQNSKIVGKVFDGSNGSALPDAVVKVESQNKGTASDLDGKYSIENLQPGDYNVKGSYVGYTSKDVKVNLKPGEIANIDIVLQPEGSITDTVTVEAVRTNNNEAGLLLKQQKSESIFDGISEQQIKRAPDAVASDVLKRVIGISIVKDKFVFVRGTSERYNNTTLNGVLIPSTESDKKAFSFDLFPSNLLDNIVISKTFTPDQPGNYSGGLVQITTKEFPEKFTLNYSMSGSYNTNSTGTAFYSYGAGEKKLGFINLGLDDGTRGLPEGIPGRPLKNNIYSRDEIKGFSRLFSNDWAQTSKSAPINGGFQLSLGNVFHLGKVPVGILGAYSYKNSFSNKDIETNDYNTDNTQLSGYKGRNSEFAVLWGGLFNLNAKINDFNKIGFKSTYSVNTTDETEYYDGFYTPEAHDRRLYITKYTERALLSSQVLGEHYISFLDKMNLKWRASYSESNRNEPDTKNMSYQRDQFSTDPFAAAINPNFGNTFGGGRFFSKLKDINRSFGFDAELPFNFKVPFSKSTISNSKIKLGGLADGTRRNFESRSFGPAYYIGAPFTILYQPIDSIFRAENFDVNKLFYDELTSATDKYTASENQYASFLMFDIPLNKLRVVLGARYEYNEQIVNSGDKNNYLKNNDVLPSVNLTYQVNDKINVRAAYSQTVSRPELREIAPFSYLDFVTGALVFGNSTDLRRTIVRNYDLRFEVFPQPGEILSFSLFYKKFDAPIEEVFIPTSTNKIKSFKNAENGANNYGLEIEARKNLGFLTKILKNVSVNANLSIINSKINLEGTGTTASKLERRMQGQSPYTINLGLFYDNYDLGTSVNLSFNRFGERISEVGLNGYEDIIEQGRSLLDFSASQRLFKNFEIKFSAKDILNQDETYTQFVNGADQTVRLIKSGPSYSFTVSFKY